MARNKYQKVQRKAGKTTLTVFIDEDLKSRIRSRARLRGVSPSEWMNKAIGKLMDDVEKKR